MKHVWAGLLIAISAQAFELGPVTVDSQTNQVFKASIPLVLSDGEVLGDKLDLKATLSHNQSLIPLQVNYDARTNDLKLTTAQKIKQEDILLTVAVAEHNKSPISQEYAIKLEAPVKPFVYGPVGAGDTLWRVATKFSEYYNITPEEAASALYTNNQRAFVNGNKDQLMAGSFLKLSAQTPIRGLKEVNHVFAPGQVNNPQSMQEPHVLAAAVDTKLEKVMPTNPSLEQGTQVAMNVAVPGPSLQLLLPKDSISQAVSNTVSTLLASDQSALVSLLESMHKDLAIAKENIDTERRVKETLQNNLNDVQLQLRALTELVSLKDQEIETLLRTYRIEQRNAPGIFEFSAIPADFSNLMMMAKHNQIVLILLAIVIASIMIFVWDQLTAGLKARTVVASMPSNPPVTTQIKANSMQAPLAPSLHEVDMCIAYGRYSQAQDILEDMLVHDPKDFDVLLKLCQVYVKSDDRLAYERKLKKVSDRWKEKYPQRWDRMHDMYMRAWPMEYENELTPTYEGDPPSDPIQTKLDLARAYIDIGDHDSASTILKEVLKQGTTSQAQAAQILLANLS